MLRPAAGFFQHRQDVRQCLADLRNEAAGKAAIAVPPARWPPTSTTRPCPIIPLE